MTTPAPRATDEQLIAEQRPGRSGEAFSTFYSRHERRILTFFLTRVRRPDLAADLTAETFAAALQSRERYNTRRGPAIGWLFGIARNVLSSSVRAGRVEGQARQRLRMLPVVLDDTTLAAVMELTDERALLEGLPAEQAAAITARVLDDRAYPDIAAEMGCSEAVVRQRVSRGLQTLRSNIDLNEGMCS